jgi:tRNA wybutosine-synthesizing protein 1
VPDFSRFLTGVTFCGKSDASNLNMTNTPWHHEVVELTRNLKAELDKLRARSRDSGGGDAPPEYDIACEHRHSCSVLLARVDQFAVDEGVDETGSVRRRWRTWIEYDKFQELAARNAADPSFTFTVRDYTAETPSWALFGSEEEGFDPTDTRHRKKTKHPMYTRFDGSGLPTHDHSGTLIPDSERDRLRRIMDDRKRQIGSGSSVVTEFRDGAKEVLDASLMFRGLVVTK